jgi:hypothetical protein
MTAGHRLLSFQVEGHVLHGTDDEADRIAAFALEMFAAIDGRPRPEPPARSRRGGSGAARRTGAAGAARPGRTARSGGGTGRTTGQGR